MVQNLRYVPLHSEYGNCRNYGKKRHFYVSAFLFGFNQKIAQGINLIAFSIMASIVIFLHFKNKLVDVKVAIRFGLIAVAFACLGAVLANLINVRYLKICFGLLLIAVAVYEAVDQIRNQFYK